MYIFEKSILINCSVKDAFEFHSDTNNLSKISPGNIKVSILKLELPLRKGSGIDLKIKQFGIFTSVWKLRIKNFEPFRLITDELISGPFKYWEHDHIFSEKDEKILMTDKVRYKLPLGAFGNMAHSVFVKRMIESQFDSRQIKTREILEKNNI